MILLYHKIDLISKSRWYVTADTFDRQMASLQAYTVVPLDEYDPGNPKHVSITFDGIYENVWRFGAPILEKWGYSYELFIIGDHIGGDNAFDAAEPLERFADANMLEDMAHRGARIQWHSKSHRRLDTLSKEDMVRELDVPAFLRERFDGPHWRWFAYPHDIDQTSCRSQYVEAAVQSKFSGALACVAGSAAERFRLNRLTVIEDTRFDRSTVSIIIANHNYGHFIAEAIDSVLHQTQQPDEILVIDDGSTDNSRDVLAAYEDRVRLVFNERNLGIVDTFRKAVKLTSGDYIGFLGADNRMRSDYVEQTKAALDSHPEAAVAYSDMVIFGPLAKVLAIKVGAEPCRSDTFFYWRFPEPTPDTLAGIRHKNFIHGSSLYRRCWYDCVGGYQKTDRAEDHDLFSRMLAAGGGAIRVPHPLIEYRQHSMEQANTVLNLQLRIAALERINQQLRETLAQIGVLSTSVHTLFELTSNTRKLQMRSHTSITWRNDGLEIVGTTDDPGLHVILAESSSKWIGLRAILHTEEVGYAQIYSQTSEEDTISGTSGIFRPIRPGWNFLTVSILRDAPIRVVRFDPSNRPGCFLLQELTLFTTR